MGKRKRSTCYAVAVGRKVGIFATWAETEQQVSGFPGAVFQGFTDVRAICELAFNTHPSLRRSIRQEAEARSFVEKNAASKLACIARPVVDDSEGSLSPPRPSQPSRDAFAASARRRASEAPRRRDGSPTFPLLPNQGGASSPPSAPHLHDLTPDQRTVYERVVRQRRNVFFTGKGAWAAVVYIGGDYPLRHLLCRGRHESRRAFTSAHTMRTDSSASRGENPLSVCQHTHAHARVHIFHHLPHATALTSTPPQPARASPTSFATCTAD